MVHNELWQLKTAERAQWTMWTEGRSAKSDDKNSLTGLVLALLVNPPLSFVDILSSVVTLHVVAHIPPSSTHHETRCDRPRSPPPGHLSAQLPPPLSTRSPLCG